MTTPSKILRIVVRLLFGLALFAIVAVGGCAGWFFLYTGDLPDPSALAVFAPETPQAISTTVCGEPVQTIAIPGRDMANLRQAVLAAEGDFDTRGILQLYFGGTNDPSDGARYGHYSFQLSRQMFCASPDKHLKRGLLEIRTAHQLDRRYSHDQLLTIYLNRAYFGADIYGVENAAKYYFGKSARDVSIAEAALIAGLIERPSYYLPTRHPDRALTRRNEVIDAMVARGNISAEEASVAKNAPLEIAPH